MHVLNKILSAIILTVDIPNPEPVWTEDKIKWISKQLRKQGVVVQDELWIDVNDHLPTSDGRFMVTIKNKGRAHVEMRNFHVESKTWEADGFCNDTVIAWQPRPKPFNQP